MPLKFGHETVESVACVRVSLTVRGRDGRTAEGWGETPGFGYRVAEIHRQLPPAKKA